MDGMLSQDEINALLNGVNADNDNKVSDSDVQTDNQTEEKFQLDDHDKDAVGEISNISLGTAATTLSSLLNQKVNITTPTVSVATWDDLSKKYDRPCVMLQISYIEGLDGNNVLVLKEKDVKVITDLMMGGTGQIDENEPLSELHLSAIGEAMNQMMGSAATSMSSMFNRKIDISPPVANVIETYTDTFDDMPEFLKHEFVMVAFMMQIGDLVDSEIMQLYPVSFAKELLNMFKVPDDTGRDNSSAAQQPQPQPAPQMSQAAPQQQPQPQPQPQQTYTAAPQMGYAQQPVQPQPNVNVQPAAFQPFSPDIMALSQQENIDLIKDVPLDVTVELGRTKKTIKEILEFAPGTIVELNKIAGEAIDILVNGKYVAKGEVVVIEESFGVRITEIIKEK